MNYQKHKVLELIKESSEVIFQVSPTKKFVRVIQEPKPSIYCLFMEFPDLSALNRVHRREKLEEIKDEIKS